MLIFITVIGLMPAALAEAAPEAPTTKHICLMDANTGAVLYEKDARSKAYPASTTKIMTTILALELCDDLEEKVNVGSNFDKRGSLMKFSNNEELRIIRPHIRHHDGIRQRCRQRPGHSYIGQPG